jgi:hypothetical protein
MERIPSQDMENPRSTRAILISTFGDKLGQLRGVTTTLKPKRGKKIKVASSQSYTARGSEEEDEDEEEES